MVKKLAAEVFTPSRRCDIPDELMLVETKMENWMLSPLVIGQMRAAHLYIYIYICIGFWHFLSSLTRPLTLGRILEA